MGAVAALWRLAIANRYQADGNLSPEQIARACSALTANSAFTGLMWALSTVTIYPALDGHLAAIYAVMICGSVAVAAFFMSLAGASFVVLAAFQLGSLSYVSLLSNVAYSPALAILSVIFGITAYRASQEFKETTRRAIVHGLTADAANVKLQRSKEVAEAANVAKSQFLAVMTHEIRTPMNGVLGALELLRYSDLNKSQQNLVETAYSSGRLLLGLLNDILDISKIEAGRLELCVESISLRSIAASVIGLFAANANQKGITLSLEFGGEVPDRVLGDPGRLRQVLLNLVGNAIKFTDSGSVKLILTSLGGGRVKFEVVDSGIGIPAEALSKLFDRFYQANGASNRKYGGTGLGLAISQNIVQAMGGDIDVQSELGKGSSFNFVVTFDIDENPAEPTLSAATSLAIGDLLSNEGGTILVVDDNEVNRTIANQMLTTLGHKVIEVENGQQALLELEQNQVDLILMDCQMPVMDGYTTTKLIRERENKLGGRHIPIVAMTANAFDTDVKKALSSGMDAHITKPYSLVELRDKVSSWLKAA